MPARRTEFCAHCGAEFAAGRLACPECGSDAETGWRSADDIVENSIALPDDEPPRRPAPRWQPFVLLLLVAGFVLWVLIDVLALL